VRRKKLAVFTATGCSACENAILDVHYQVSSLTGWVDIAFWPYLMGCQWGDLEKGGPIDVCFFSGAISTESDREAAVKLREKSEILVACGACASFGGLPGLSNLAREAQSTPPAQAVGEELALVLPKIEPRVSGLAQVVTVDYVVPGCPPIQSLLWTALQALVCEGESPTRLSFATSRLPEALAAAVAAGIPPAPGSTFAGERAVCASCSREKQEKKFQQYYRPFEISADPGRCLLEQGLLCQGLATREGCGGICAAVGAGCRGCFGKAEAVLDPGAKMVSAISSTFDSSDAAAIQAISEKFVDLAGTFYRYTLPTQCVLMSGPEKE